MTPFSQVLNDVQGGMQAPQGPAGPDPLAGAMGAGPPAPPVPPGMDESGTGNHLQQAAQEMAMQGMSKEEFLAKAGEEFDAITGAQPGENAGQLNSQPDIEPGMQPGNIADPNSGYA